MNRDFVQLTATQRLMELLASMNHQIAYMMIEQIKYRHNTPISFLDFGDTNDTVSFVHSAKVWELMDEHGDRYKEQGWKTKRSLIKVGKMIKLLYGETFPLNPPKGSVIPKPPIDIETFVNMFKAERDKNKNYERFELVKGKDIRFWYNQANYSRFIQEDTTLAKSCSRYEEAGKYLELYVANPNLVNMLILKDDVNRLRARAIVWNLTEPEGRIYMDRIYSINDYDVELYKNYAREQGWLYKSRQTYGYSHNIIDGKNGEELNWEKFIMRAQTKVKPHRYFPYLDTLCVYNTENGMLSNEGKLLRKPPHIRLNDPQGSFFDEADYREQVFSRYFNEEIPREEAQYVELDQDWVYSGDVVYVHNTGGKNSFSSSPLIVASDILNHRKYFLKEECVWSEYLKTFIYKDSVKEAYIDKDKVNKVLIHRRMIGKLFAKDKQGDIVKKKQDQGGKTGLSKALKDKYLKERYGKMSEGPNSYYSPYTWGNEPSVDGWTDRNVVIDWNRPADDEDTEEPTPAPRSRPARRTSYGLDDLLRDTDEPTRPNLGRPGSRRRGQVGSGDAVVRGLPVEEQNPFGDDGPQDISDSPRIEMPRVRTTDRQSEGRSLRAVRDNSVEPNVVRFTVTRDNGIHPVFVSGNIVDPQPQVQSPSLTTSNADGTDNSTADNSSINMNGYVYRPWDWVGEPNPFMRVGGDTGDHTNRVVEDSPAPVDENSTPQVTSDNSPNDGPVISQETRDVIDRLVRDTFSRVEPFTVHHNRPERTGLYDYDYDYNWEDVAGHLYHDDIDEDDETDHTHRIDEDINDDIDDVINDL